MSDHETTPEVENMLKRIMGDPTAEQRRLLYNDWSFFIATACFLDLCHVQPNPRAYGRNMVSIWRKRLDVGTRKEFDALKELRGNPIVALFRGVMNDQSSIEGATQDNLNEITAELLAIVETLPDAKAS